jgi:hypothetical protein
MPTTFTGPGTSWHPLPEHASVEHASFMLKAS